MFCSKCGKEYVGGICPQCGAYNQPKNGQPQNAPNTQYQQPMNQPYYPIASSDVYSDNEEVQALSRRHPGNCAGLPNVPKETKNEWMFNCNYCCSGVVFSLCFIACSRRNGECCFFKIRFFK